MKNSSKNGSGTNPNSHHNKPKLSSQGSISRPITLSPSQWEIVSTLGKGNKSKGVRLAINKAIYLEKVLTLVKTAFLNEDVEQVKLVLQEAILQNNIK